jgi:hypothetical protein
MPPRTRKTTSAYFDDATPTPNPEPDPKPKRSVASRKKGVSMPSVVSARDGSVPTVDATTVQPARDWVDQSEFTPLPSPLGILFIGDPHVKVSNATQEDEMFESTLAIARQHKPDVIVVLGDVFDTHSRLDLFPTNAATRWLRSLADATPRLVVIPGNHDMMSDNAFLSEVHPFTALKYWENVSVPDQGEVLTFKDAYSFIALPYVYRGRFEEALGFVCARHVSPISGGNAASVDVAEAIRDTLENTVGVIAHQEWRGCKLGAMVSVHGDTWSADRPVVVSGHIHEHGWVQPNICYVGTPIQHSAADRDVKTVSWFRVVPRADAPTEGETAPLPEPGQLPLRTQCRWTLAEQRIRLNVKRRVQLKTPAIAFLATHPNIDPATCYFEWRVEGTLAELAGLRKTDHWKKWAPYIQAVRKRDDPVLQTLPSEGTTVASVASGERKSVSDGRSFMAVLHDEASCVPALATVFRRVFDGGIN